jgi:prepilin-type N-terminal cleavage/methylation domain-containing protein
MITNHKQRGHLRGHLRGFTLIELLVVIAIIGILSAVVLAALNTARSKGNDASIKTDLTSIQEEAALYYDSNSQSYGTFAAATCPTSYVASSTSMFTADQTIVNAINGIKTNQSNTLAATCYASTSNGGVWYAYAQLTTNNTQYWCVDSTGQSKQENGTPVNASFACS